MRKLNVPRFIWITSLFLLLIIILICVMVYKIKYQYAFSKELYFYECDGTLCVMEVKSDDKLMYSKYDCGEDECPFYKRDIDENYVLLTKDEETILYHYRDGKVISNDYDDYLFINQNYIIVTKSGYQGVIDLKGSEVVPLEYSKIGYYTNNYLSGYNLEYIVAQKNDKYGIISFKTGDVLEKFETEESDLDTLLDKLKEESIQ